MISSEFDDHYILYRDTAGLNHAGFIVGQSEDRSTVFVQADYEVLGIKPTGNVWDWSIQRDALGRATVLDLTAA